MLNRILEKWLLPILILTFSCTCSAEETDWTSVREVLFQAESGDPYGLWVPENDARLQAIRDLRRAGSPEAIEILQAFLTSHGGNRKLKQHALVALGRIGTGPAVDAIRHFETWSRTQFMEPSPFRFGKTDFAIDHFSPHELQAAAETADKSGRNWAFFSWHRFGTSDLWLTSSAEGGQWSQPILLCIPNVSGIPRGAECGLEVEGDTLTILFEGREIESRISDSLVDSDEDGLPDCVESRVLTDPKDPDTDKDLIPDGKDSNPLTPRHESTDDVAEIRQAVFSALFATSCSQDAIVVVGNEDFTKQEYYGYGGVVLHSPRSRDGFVNITGIEVKIESETRATATISDWEGSEAASGHEAKLNKVNGKWIIVEFGMTRIS